jgi:tetratricopeptide (TPR) repeat protein
MSIAKYEKLFFKANRLINQQKFKKAEKVLRQAIRLKNDDPNSWSNLGAVLKVQGKYDGAVKAFKRAIALNPNYLNAWINLGATLFEMGDEKGSRWAMIQASKSNPELFASAVNQIDAAMTDAIVKMNSEEL